MPPRITPGLSSAAPTPRATRFKSATLAAAALLAFAPLADAGFKLTVTFADNELSDIQKTKVQEAADYWNKLISGYAPGVSLTGYNITVSTVNDENETYLAYASVADSIPLSGKTYTTAGSSAINLFYYGTGTTFQGANELGDVMKHEFGHTLGIGSLWVANGLYVINSGEYTGKNGLKAWQDEFSQSDAKYVPVELEGEDGSRNKHWNENVHFDEKGNIISSTPTGFVSKYTGEDFRYELMTGWANTPTFTSSVTLGSLKDLGYVIGIPLDENGDYVLTSGGYFGLMEGAHKMRKITSGTAFVGGDNTYTLGSYIEAGTLEIGSENALGTGAVYVQNGARLDTAAINLTGIAKLVLEKGSISGTTGSIIAGSFELKSGTLSAKLAGAGTVTKTTTATVTVLAAQTYTGGTTILAGTLVAANPAALSTGPVTITGGVLSVGTTNVAGAGAVTLESGSIIGDTGSLAASSVTVKSGTVSAKLAGTGSLTKTGAGEVTLSGENTFTGGVTLTQGVLNLANNAALGAGALTMTGGTLNVGDSNVAGVTTLTLTGGEILARKTVSGTVTSGSGSLAAANFTLISGKISANLGGTGTLAKTGSGDVTLSGNNTFSGGLTVSAGTLYATGSGSLGAGSATVSGGALAIAETNAAAGSTITVNGGAIRFGALTAATFGGLTGTGALLLQNDSGAALALSAGQTNADTEYAGAFSGSGSFTKIGTGKLILSGASTHTGGTTVANGTLVVSRLESLGSGATTVAGGTLDFGSRASVTLPGAFVLADGAVTGSGTLAASSVELRAGTGDISFTGSAVKTGDGLVELKKANTFSALSVDAGTLRIRHIDGLGVAPVTINGGTLDLTVDLNDSGTLLLKSGALAGEAGSITASSYELQSGRVETTLRGFAPLEKTTAGTVTLLGANALTGRVNVRAGTLVAEHTSALGSGVVTVASDATLQVGDNNAFGVTWSGNQIRLEDNATLDLRLTSKTLVRRAVNGTGGLVQNGSGTITLANATYSGATVVNAGKLILDPAGPMPSGALRAQGAGAIEFDSASRYDLTRDIAGDGAVRLAGESRIRRDLSLTGALVVTSGSSSSLGAATGDSVTIASRLLSIESGARLAGSGRIAGSLANAGTLSPGFSPGVITLGGDFTNTGTLVMEVSSTGAHDEIRYAGQAFLGGTLEIRYLDGIPLKGSALRILTDTYTADGRPSVVGDFATVVLPAGGGIVYGINSGLEFIVQGTVFDIPGAAIPEAGRLLPFAEAVSAASVNSPAIAAAISPFTMTGAQMASAIRSAAPLGLAAATALPIAESLRDSDELNRHLNARRFDRAFGSIEGFAPYFSANGVNATNEENNDGPAFDHTTVGGAVGMDTQVDREFLVGARVGYDSGRANFHHNGGKLNQDHARVTFYGSKLFEGRNFADFGVFGGYSLYDTKRRTPLGTEKGDSSGWDAGALVNVGRLIPLTSSFSVTPFAGFVYTHAQVDGFDETGSAFALRVKGFSQDSLASRLGASLNQVARVGDLDMRVSLGAAWVHELLDTETDIGGSIAGAGFTTAAVATLKDRLEIGPELEVGVGDGKAVTGSYKLDYGFGDGVAHRFDVGYRMRF